MMASYRHMRTLSASVINNISRSTAPSRSTAFCKNNFPNQSKVLCHKNFLSATDIKSRWYSSDSNDDIPRENIPISRFPVPDVNSLDPDVKERIQTITEKSGFTPNVFSVLSHRPAEFRAFFDYYDALMEKETGSLTKAEKELIVVVTSSANDCVYCVVAHGALHRIYSKKKYVADQAAINWEVADLTPREKAIVDFAMDVCHCEAITEEHFTELEHHGLDREDAWDIGAIAAFFALSNRMAHMTGMRPNEEFYLMGRVQHKKKK